MPAGGSRRSRASHRARPDVIELELVGGAADAAALEGELAPALVALPDCALHVGRDVVVPRGGPRLRPGLLDEPAPLGVALEEEVEASLEDRLVVPVREGVRERGLRSRELLEEAAGDGDVHPAQLRREGDDVGRRWTRRDRKGEGCGFTRRRRFVQTNRELRTRSLERERRRRKLCPHGNDDGPLRRRLAGLDLRGDDLRLALREERAERGQDARGGPGRARSLWRSPRAGGAISCVWRGVPAGFTASESSRREVVSSEECGKSGRP